LTEHLSIDEGRVQATTLSNGFRVVTEHMPHVKSAAIGVSATAGARDETPPEGGLSHMLEHMAFKGTTSRTAKRIVEEIEDVGGDLNAYTDYEVTAYQARVLAEHVPMAIDLIADILRDSTFDEGEIEKERQVILQEIGERNDMPSMAALETLQETCFPDQALGRPIIGTPEKVLSFDRSMISAYMGRHYAPDRLILSAAGFVDHDETVKAAERLFGDMESRVAPAREAGAYKPGATRLVRDVEQAHVCLGFASPDSRDFDAQFQAQAVAAVLGGGMSSRLFQEAREERGLCYSIYSYAEAFEDAGMMTIYAATSPEQAEEMITLALDVFERAADDISEEETNRARAQSKAGLVMGLESPMRRSESLSRQMALFGRPIPMEEIVAMVDRVDASTVRTAARSLLDGPAPSMVYLGPEAGRLPDLSKRAA
jgi:predicted Zn-dependent peptidase